jgi:hypothetical protein
LRSRDGIDGLLSDARASSERVLRLLEGVDGDAPAAAREAAARALDNSWTVLVSGLRSTGKSSLVSALWGDSELLPTAVRDCTQTNTLVRVPREGEPDRAIRLNYLPREEAVEFASRDLSYHRLHEVVTEVLGPTGPKLDEEPAARRIALAAETVRRLFREREDVHVLHEPATEQLETLEDFLAYSDSPEYRPGEAVARDWSERREYLMGRRRPDGRTLEVGKLLSLRLVELVRATGRWGDLPPRLVDSPWIPTFHNARRADLILREARGADAMVITALPEPFALEEWTLELFRERPDLRSRTLVVFNQVDTVDTSMLFSRGGFAEAWAANVAALTDAGLDPANVFASCARLPFLEGLPPDSPLVARDPFGGEMSARLRTVLAKIARLAEDRPEDAFTRRLAAACDPHDAGVESVRARLVDLAKRDVRLARARDACDAVMAVAELDMPADRAPEWRDVRERAAKLAPEVRAALPPTGPSLTPSGRRKRATLPGGRPLFKDDG